MYVLTNCKQLEILKRRRIVDRKRRKRRRDRETETWRKRDAESIRDEVEIEEKTYKSATADVRERVCD